MSTGIMLLIAATLFLQEVSKNWIIFSNGFHMSTKCHINNFLEYILY